MTYCSDLKVKRLEADWMDFDVDNQLRVDDACVFELVIGTSAEVVFQVSIPRGGLGKRSPIRVPPSISLWSSWIRGQILGHERGKQELLCAVQIIWIPRIVSVFSVSLPIEWFWCMLDSGCNFVEQFGNSTILPVNPPPPPPTHNLSDYLLATVPVSLYFFGNTHLEKVLQNFDVQIEGPVSRCTT